MTLTTSPVDRTLEEMLDPLRKLDEQLDERERSLKQELEEVRAERRKLKSVLNAAFPSSNGAVKKAKPPSTSITYNPSTETLELVAAWMTVNAEALNADGGFFGEQLYKDFADK